jgi:hypothetical protein
MAEHTIEIGKRHVLASGSVVLQKDVPVSIKGPQISVTISFREDPPSPTPERSVHWVVDDGVLNVMLHNWSNPLGTAIESRIGTVNGTPLVMALFVHSVGPEQQPAQLIRVLNYTFSVGELES